MLARCHVFLSGVQIRLVFTARSKVVPVLPFQIPQFVQRIHRFGQGRILQQSADLINGPKMFLLVVPLGIVPILVSMSLFVL